jgi:hypothetical protein
MTDALAEWFINEGENAIGKISVWKSQSDFKRFISQAIEENQMTNDDCAILCIELSEVEKNGFEYITNQVTDLNDLINDQEDEKEKIKQKKLEEEIRGQEKHEEIQNSKEFETSQNESQTPDSIVKENKEILQDEEFISKGINAPSKEEDEKKEAEVLEEKTSTELDNIEKHTTEHTESTSKEPSDTETKVAKNQNSENDKNEELEKEKIEEEVKSNNEKIEAEKLEVKEQPKVDSKAKNIFDKF